MKNIGKNAHKRTIVDETKELTVQLINDTRQIENNRIMNNRQPNFLFSCQDG